MDWLISALSRATTNAVRLATTSVPLISFSGTYLYDIDVQASKYSAPDVFAIDRAIPACIWGGTGQAHRLMTVRGRVNHYRHHDQSDDPALILGRSAAMLKAFQLVEDETRGTFQSQIGLIVVLDDKPNNNV